MAHIIMRKQLEVQAVNCCLLFPTDILLPNSKSDVQKDMERLKSCIVAVIM